MDSRSCLTFSALLLALPVTSHAQITSPPPFSDELLAKGKAADPSAGYAQTFGVSLADAKERLSLQEQASDYAQSLIESGPPEFVTLIIRHTPNFKITVFYEKAIDRAALMRSAPIGIRRYLVFNPMNKSRAKVDQDRATIASGLRTANLRFGLEFDYESDRFTLDLPEDADQAQYLAAIPTEFRSRVDFRKNTMAVDIAAAYGGSFITNSAGNCTSGWPIKDSKGAEAILTAGHCTPPDSIAFSGGPTLASVSFKNTPTDVMAYDYAIFPLGTGNTTSRVVYVNNDNVSNPDGTSNYIVGFTSAYYEIAAPLAFTVGQYVCKQGQKTRLTCGTVTDTNYSDDKNSGNIRVSNSLQGNIAFAGDSGGPVFLWTTNNSQVRPMGLVKSANPPSASTACKNTSTTATNNSYCYFTVMPLKKINARSPIKMNTTGGFVAP